MEYAAVLVAFLSMVLALGAIWQGARGGPLLGSAIGASSHQLGGDALGFLRDVALF